MAEKLSDQEVRSRIGERKIALVGNWQGSKLPHVFQCQLGHQWKTRGDSVLQGHGCPECARLLTKLRHRENAMARFEAGDVAWLKRYERP